MREDKPDDPFEKDDMEVGYDNQSNTAGDERCQAIAVIAGDAITHIVGNDLIPAGKSDAGTEDQKT